MQLKQQLNCFKTFVSNFITIFRSVALTPDVESFLRKVKVLIKCSKNRAKIIYPKFTYSINA